MWVVIFSLSFCVFLLFCVLLLWSPGKMAPILDKDGTPLAGSISEKVHVDINGERQGMFIKGNNVNNPVILFLHGGAGMPEYFLTQRYPLGLEEHFTICWWERRGSGLSYHVGMSPENMTVEQMISDTLAVTNYLRDRFGKEKIILMAHSGGTFFGIQVAARAPELFQAYIGVAQMAYQLRSEIQSYELMVRQYGERGDARMVRKLERHPPSMEVPLPNAYMALRDKAMHGLGIGTMHEMRSVVTGIFIPVWQERAYTIREKVAIWKGKSFSHRCFWNEMIATDLTKIVTKLDLPIYFCSGEYDYTVSIKEARSFFEKIQAPLKGFYTFEKSAHSPMFEEPDMMLRIMQEDVLTRSNHLADNA